MRNLCDECDAGYKGMCTMEDRPCKAKEWYDCGRKDAIDELIKKLEDFKNDGWNKRLCNPLPSVVDDVIEIAEQMRGEAE